MNCQICQRAIYRDLEVGGENIPVCPTWDCMYSHYLQTQSNLLQAYTTLYKQHTTKPSSIHRNSSWAMRVALSNPTTHLEPINDDEIPQPRKFFKLDQDQEQMEPVDISHSEEEVLKISQSQTQSLQVPVSEIHEPIDSPSSEYEPKAFDLSPYEFTSNVLPPDMEEDAIDYLRFHIKYFSYRISPKAVLLSLNFILNKLNVEDPMVTSNFRFKFDMYIKSLDRDKIEEVKRMLVRWIKDNKMLIKRIRQEQRMQPTERRADPVKDQKVKQEKKRIIETWEKVQDIQGLNVERIDDIESLLEDKLRSH